jgi:hypothetical protein
MMKQFLSILLSFVLLASHINLTMGTHFCGGEAVETKIMLVDTHLGCEMEDMDHVCGDPENINNQNGSFNTIPCCENKFHTVQTTDEFVKDTFPTLFAFEFVVAIVHCILNPGVFPDTNHTFYTDYSPPPLEIDIPILFQSFLI